THAHRPLRTFPTRRSSDLDRCTHVDHLPFTGRECAGNRPGRTVGQCPGRAVVAQVQDDAPHVVTVRSAAPRGTAAMCAVRRRSRAEARAACARRAPGPPTPGTQASP